MKTSGSYRACHSQVQSISLVRNPVCVQFVSSQVKSSQVYKPTQVKSSPWSSQVKSSQLNSTFLTQFNSIQVQCSTVQSNPVQPNPVQFSSVTSNQGHAASSLWRTVGPELGNTCVFYVADVGLCGRRGAGLRVWAMATSHVHIAHSAAGWVLFFRPGG